MKNKIVHILIGALLIPMCLSAQDPHFTQFYANTLYLNPAFAGTAVCPRITLNFRNQWENIPGNYNTYSLGYDKQVSSINGGLGIIAVGDRQGAGTISTYSLAGMYSYNISSGPGMNFKAGIEVRVFQRSLDWDKLHFGDQIDPRYGNIYKTAETKPTKTSTIVPDFSFGLLGYGKTVYGGVAIHHLTQPNESFFDDKSVLPRKYTAHIGALLNLKPGKQRPGDPKISPNFIYQNQRNLTQFNYGIYVNKYPIIFGLWYRNALQNSDALSVLVGLQVESLKIGYSYDMTVSKLGPSTAGAHELSCGFVLPCRPPVKKIRPINCPTF